MSNIMVIYPMPNESKKPRFGFSYDMMIIATVLDNEGHNVCIKDYSCEMYSPDFFKDEIIDNRIDLVLIEFDSFALKRSENNIHGAELVRLIRSMDEEISVITYGHYCCISKADIPMTNYTIKENNFNEIFSAINKINISLNKIRFINDFDSLPIIKRGLLRQIDYYRQNSKSTLVQTAIGCENTCVFCQRKGWQSKYQTHSEQYVLEEFKLLNEQQYINIWIIDENFTFNLNRAKKILQLLISNKITENMKISISSWSNIDNEFLDMAKQANIKTISFGVESANQSILNFYRKNIDLEKTKILIKYANRIGIFTIGNFIIGAPMESHETINNTFKFIKECEFDQVNIKTLDYMMGSELYASVKNFAHGRSHMFACAENGINQFRLQEITALKSNFLKKYYVDNKERINQKIRKFGAPYEY